jgi:transposase
MAVHKGTLPMSLGNPRALSPGCGTDSNVQDYDRGRNVQDRFIVLQTRRQRFSNATTLRNDLQNATGVRVSTQSVRNRLHDAGLMLRSQQFAFL